MSGCNPSVEAIGVPGQKKPRGTWNRPGSSAPTTPCMHAVWSIPPQRARRIAGLLKGGCRWLTRSMVTKPVGSRTRVLTPLAACRSAIWSCEAYSCQSVSPAISAEVAVEVSPMTRHSTRSKWTTFGPEVQVSGPSGRGT
ncbi:hypothetical protein ABIC30_001537 [Methylobacterium sp. 1030]